MGIRRCGRGHLRRPGPGHRGGARGATLAFAIAGLVYILIGRGLFRASLLPCGRRGPLLRAARPGRFLGLCAGAALLLDYTIDIALFAVASTGYVNFFLPGFGIQLRGFLRGAGAVPGSTCSGWRRLPGLILVLTWLNVRGIRDRPWLMRCWARSTSAGGVHRRVGPGAGLGARFTVAAVAQEFPQPHRFIYGFSRRSSRSLGWRASLRPRKRRGARRPVIPRTSLGLIFSILVLALGFSTVTLGILPWQEFRAPTRTPSPFWPAHPLSGRGGRARWRPLWAPRCCSSRPTRASWARRG